MGIQMELCGKSLESYLDAKKQLSLGEVHSFLLQIALAFRYLAEKGLVHRDFKLDNVCFTAGSEDDL